MSSSNEVSCLSASRSNSAKMSFYTMLQNISQCQPCTAKCISTSVVQTWLYPCMVYLLDFWCLHLVLYYLHSPPLFAMALFWNSGVLLSCFSQSCFFPDRLRIGPSSPYLLCWLLRQYGTCCNLQIKFRYLEIISRMTPWRCNLVAQMRHLPNHRSHLS